MNTKQLPFDPFIYFVVLCFVDINQLGSQFSLLPIPT